MGGAAVCKLQLSCRLEGLASDRAMGAQCTASGEHHDSMHVYILAPIWSLYLLQLT